MFTIGFDLDLTLIDSRQRILSAATRSFTDLGFHISADSLLPHMGVPIDAVATELVPEIDAIEFLRRYRGYYDTDTQTPVPVLPGAHEALAMIEQLGGQAVVVSAKQQAAAARAVADAGLRVAAVIGGHFGAHKGDALRRYPRVLAYVGDHAEDAQAARAAGCRFIGVTTGEFTAAALTAAGADDTIDSLIELAAMVPNLADGEPTSR